MRSFIEVQNVAYHYRDRQKKQALGGVSFKVERGKRVMVLGPNGGGKTTLFKLLATLLPLQQGEIEIDSISLRSNPKKVREKLGIVFQSPSLDPKLTVYENLKCHGALYALGGRTLAAWIEHSLEALKLTKRGQERVETLSGGLKRRVEIAKALLTSPSILLLDEPTTGLDPEVRAQLWHSLDELQKEQELTILCTTHLLEEAKHADQIAILDEGNLVAFGEPQKMQAELDGNRLTIYGSFDMIESQLSSMREKNPMLQFSRKGDAIYIHSSDEFLIDSIFQNTRKIADQISWSKPTIEDLYFQKTGKHWNHQEEQNKERSSL